MQLFQCFPCQMIHRRTEIVLERAETYHRVKCIDYLRGAGNIGPKENMSNTANENLFIPFIPWVKSRKKGITVKKRSQCGFRNGCVYRKIKELRTQQNKIQFLEKQLKMITNNPNAILADDDETQKAYLFQLLRQVLGCDALKPKSFFII